MRGGGRILDDVNDRNWKTDAFEFNISMST